MIAHCTCNKLLRKVKEESAQVQVFTVKNYGMLFKQDLIIKIVARASGIG